MGNGYNHNFQYQQSLNLHKTPHFLPMLCSKTSIKDVKLTRLEECSTFFSDDPLSPKISCMGQVNRNNKIIGFPTAAASCSHSKLSFSSSKSNNDVKYFKLKRLFSCRNILSSNNTSCTASSCRRREVIGNNGASKAPDRADENQEREEKVSIHIAEMDPPLPVIKRVPKKPSDEGDDENSNNLWKKRSSGGGLRTLELEMIKIPRRHQVEITTV